MVFRVCTGLVQPLDVLINRPFKNILKEKLDCVLDKLDDKEFDILGSKSAVGQHQTLAKKRFCHGIPASALRVVT